MVLWVLFYGGLIVMLLNSTFYRTSYLMVRRTSIRQLTRVHLTSSTLTWATCLSYLAPPHLAKLNLGDITAQSSLSNEENYNFSGLAQKSELIELSAVLTLYPSYLPVVNAAPEPLDLTLEVKVAVPEIIAKPGTELTFSYFPFFVLEDL